MVIKRSIYPEIKKHLKSDEITFLVGPRQAGKTTIMLSLSKILEKKGEKSLYLNLDIEKDRHFFSSQDKLLQKIKLQLGNKKGYVFIDEIQRKENAGLFLKGLYDMRLPYKFVVTGSGSVELKEKIYESLAGRKRIFEIFPLSFDEFCNFKTNYSYEEKLHDFLKSDKKERIRLLEEYMTFGGYPRVVLAENTNEKRLTLEDIYKSFIEKDIQILLKIEKTEKLTDLLKIIGAQSGRLTNISGLSNALNVSIPTVNKYLWYLEKTYVLVKSVPFFRNVKKEVTKSPIYYFMDLGLRNYLLNIDSFERVLDKGFLFQNFVFNDLGWLVKDSTISRKFWRSKNGAEVDIVLDTYPAPIAVEVKFSSKTVKATRALTSFTKKYKAKKSFVTTTNLEYLDLEV